MALLSLSFAPPPFRTAGDGGPTYLPSRVACATPSRISLGSRPEWDRTAARPGEGLAVLAANGRVWPTPAGPGSC